MSRRLKPSQRAAVNKYVVSLAKAESLADALRKARTQVRAAKQELFAEWVPGVMDALREGRR